VLLIPTVIAAATEANAKSSKAAAAAKTGFYKAIPLAERRFPRKLQLRAIDLQKHNLLSRDIAFTRAKVSGARVFLVCTLMDVLLSR
jgi:hypothetical protein